MASKASHFFDNLSKWKDEFDLLREIVGAHQSLDEDFKWMHPCYTFKGKNVIIMHGFKDYCALLFIKGALLEDKKHILIQQTADVQSARQIRFTSIEEIKKHESSIISYISEAIDIEKSGKKIEKKTTADYPVPEEFQTILSEDPDLATAFKSLTPGRQRAYIFYFNQAKQAKTRQARIMKYYQHILAKKGIDDT